MPRPKLRPEDRQRSSKACLACKASKIRCDSKLPCAACIKRHRETSCTYADTDRRRLHQSVRDRRINRPGERSQSPGPGPASGNATFHSAPNQHTPTAPSGSPETSCDGGSSAATPHLHEVLHSPEDQSDDRQEQVDTSETASLSFLHFLRNILKPYVGSMPFTDGQRHHRGLEPDISDGRSERLNVSPEEMYSLLESYFEGTSGLLYLFTADEIDMLVSERALPEEFDSLSSTRRVDAAALDIALAIGAQIRASSDPSSQVEKGLFNRAQHIAFEDMLTNQSPSLIRLFLLLAFYMLGASNRNAAYMYLGVSAKAAVILGLHHLGSYKRLRHDERSARLRIWHSLRNIDILTSFIVGRPKSLPVTRIDTSHTKETEEESLQYSHAFNAIRKGCSLLEDIVAQLNKSNMLHVPTAENLLEQLRKWSRDLPPTLRRFTFVSGDGASLDPADRQLLAGNLHVSCMYYFAVILVTRPFLVAYLTSRLRGRAPDQLISDPDEASDINIKNNEVSKLAQVCVSSAVYMSDMCQKAKTSNFTFRNLCLLEAWIFGAGLVLGFSMFAGEPRQDIEDSFGGAREVLDSIAATSSQARLYHEILTSFSEAVSKYRQRVSGEVRRTVQHYMDQILIVDVPGNMGGQHYPSPSSGNTNGNLDEQLAGVQSNTILNMFDTRASIQQEVQGLLNQAGHEDMTGEMGYMDMQLSHTFILGIEPFENLFYCVE